MTQCGLNYFKSVTLKILFELNGVYDLKPVEAVCQLSAKTDLEQGSKHVSKLMGKKSAPDGIASVKASKQDEVRRNRKKANLAGM